MAYTKQHINYSLADYLAVEHDAETKSEYVAGQVYAMAGASERHNTIAGEFYTVVNAHLPLECRAWQSDMKVTGNYSGDDFAYYPDIMASCEENTGDPYVRTNPLLIIEVLSKSTQRTDLKEKFDNYIHIPSLMEYVVVSQEEPLIRVFRRSQDWALNLYGADDHLYLESIDLEVAVMHIYRRVRNELGL